jgi:glycosyltransferase involved in cell wall biosynthesis
MAAARGITVVIATVERPAELERALRAVERAAAECHEPVEIVVADDGGHHGTAATVAAVAATSAVVVRLIAVGARPRAGPARARNAGANAATYDIIAFTDDDAVCDARWLAVALQRLRGTPELAGVECAVRPDLTGLRRPHRARVVMNLAGGGYLTAALVLRASALARVGGFRTLGPPQSRWWLVPFREDSDCALRIMNAVGPIAFEPAAIVMHPVEEPRLRRQLQVARYFIVDAVYLRVHRDRLRNLRRPWARGRIRLACLAVGAVPLLGRRRTRAIALGIVGTAGLALAGHSSMELRQAGWRPGAAATALMVLRAWPRSVAWALVAGASRLLGEALVVSGRVPAAPSDGGDRAAGQAAAFSDESITKRCTT